MPDACVFSVPHSSLFSRIALYFKGWPAAARSWLHAIAESTAGAQAGEGERRQIILPSYMHGCTPEVHERVDHDAICPLTPRERLFVVLRPLGLWSIC